VIAHRAVASVVAAAVAVTVSMARAADAPGSSRSPATDGSLAARLSSADTATEYWDITAWFDGGERFVARFLITNQGPGERTAAAYGHVLLADGRALPFKWGRLQDHWKIDPAGRIMKIGKARLDVSGPNVVVSVDSAKHGVVARLEIERALPHGRAKDLEAEYEVDYSLPGAARGTIGVDGTPRIVGGSGAIVHTSLPRLEGDVIRRRDEVMARSATHALYVSSVLRLDGTRRTLLVASGPDLDDHGIPPTTVDFSGPEISGDPAYPVASAWRIRGEARRYEVTLRHELLRLKPLDILPLPFRVLLSFGSAPQRTWANATVVVAADDSKETATLDGIAVSTFANPER
jgi:hypothetical protein